MLSGDSADRTNENRASEEGDFGVSAVALRMSIQYDII